MTTYPPSSRGYAEGRDARQDRAGTLAHVAERGVFRQDRFHDGEHGLVQRDVDDWPVAGLARDSSAIKAPITPYSDASVSPG